MNGTQPRPGGSHANGTNNDGFTLLVGTFRSPEIYTLNFKPPTKATRLDPRQNPASLTVAQKSTAYGGHSWLSLSPNHTRLYTTCWSQPPAVASYSIDPHTKAPTLLNTKPVASLSGYVVVTPSGKHLISAGGPSGEVFRLEADGRIGALVQTLPFRKASEVHDGAREGVAHGSFGGLRWGAHSVDIGPAGRTVYVADIGHNCIWSYHLDEEESSSQTEEADVEGGGGGGPLRLGTKHIAPRAHDGPRHCWPHPNGRVLYCVEEHSGMVDAFRVDVDGVTLGHLHGYSILPPHKSADKFWADEVRTSNLPAGGGVGRPRYLYASTRGLEPGTKGYVAAYELDDEGCMKGPALDIYETRTSGGLANAIEPAPQELYQRPEVAGEEEFIALTDSEEGWVVILGWNGKKFREVASVKLKGEDGSVVGAATAVWL